LKATSTWLPGTNSFDGATDSGHTVRFDASAAHTDGPSPMEAVLAALCACTSVDVVSILEKKRTPLRSLVVTAEAEQAPAAPRVFTRIKLVYRVDGEALTRKGVEDAVALSKDKYCSVSLMLGHSVAFEYAIEYAGTEPAD
jgi:putative redox protein